MGSKNFCFCFPNRKSSKTKQDGSSHSKSGQKIRSINAMSAEGRAGDGNHGGATTNPGGNDAGAAVAAVIATSHISDMDGSSHGGGGGHGGADGGGGGE